VDKGYSSCLALRVLMRRMLICLLTLGYYLCAQQAQAQGQANRASVFITAHQDDWQLFMGSRAYDVVQRGDKTVFICITAGQAAGDEDWWRAREAGTVNSARTAADGEESLGPGRAVTVPIRGHAVTAYPYKNTVVYFLRLPDGGYDGTGYPTSNFESLGKLKKGQASATTVDKVNTYASWQELVSTVRTIIQREVDDNAELTVHSSHPNVAYNANDHRDHLLAGLVADQATRSMECFRVLYQGYLISKKPVNLAPKQTAKQSMLFAAYCRGLTDANQPTSWVPDHLCWFGRQYSYTRHEASAASMASSQGPRSLRPNNANLPKELNLNPAAPNPFNFSTLLSYDLPEQEFVTLDVYDLRGNLIQSIVREEQKPGHYNAWLDVNRFPSSGIYICRLQAGKEHREQRVQLER
jgi:hypothetical protein